MKPFWEERMILRVYAGSHSYGTNTKDSDEDFRGIAIPPANYLLGMDEWEQFERKEPDTVIYSLKKFVKLALGNNPNILDALFVADNHILFINEFGHELRDLRYEFLSKQVYKTYGGYAYGQLYKMTKVDKNAEGKRLASIQKYGYDTKNAMHLIRLLKMGIEVLMEREVNVLRYDNRELLDIRNGKFTREEIEIEAKRLQVLLSEAYIKTELPAKPNYEKINDWVTSVQRRSLNWGGNS